MKRVLILLLLAAPVAAYAQVVGKQFPNLPAETVEDKVVTLPTDTKGKFTLVGLAYSKKSEDDLNSWFNPIYNKFINKPKDGGGLFAAFTYDVNVYFVPMFTGVNAAATGTAKKKAAKNIDARLLPHVLFYKGEIKTYKEVLELEGKDVPYFYVLDKNGKIVYTTSGKFTNDKLDEIEEILDDE
jgi:hypothetical protein